MKPKTAPFDQLLLRQLLADMFTFRRPAVWQGMTLKYTPAAIYGVPYLSVAGEKTLPTNDQLHTILAALERVTPVFAAIFSDSTAEPATRNITWGSRPGKRAQ